MKEKVLTVLVDYINTNFYDLTDATKSLNGFSSLVKYININHLDLDIQDYIFLVQNNELIQNALQIICKEKADYLKTGGLNKISNTFLVTQLIRIYCDLNDIEIVEVFNDDDRLPNNENSSAFYYNQIKRIALLTKEEEHELFAKLENGDLNARNLIVEKNLRYVAKIANRFVNRGLSYDDLVQEGNEGLIHAVEMYDPSKGCRFTTYATYWIEQRIIRAIANYSRTIRLPVYQYEKVRRFYSMQEKVRKKLGKEPDFEEVVAEMDISQNEAKKLQTMIHDVLSLNTIIGEEENTELSDFIPVDDMTPEEYIIAQETHSDIEKLFEISNLTPKETKVLTLRFGLFGGEPHTLEQIGQYFNVTRERIRQIIIKAIRKIKMASEGKVSKKNQASIHGFVGYPEELVNKVLDYFPEQEKNIINKRFLRNNRGKKIVEILTKEEYPLYFAALKQLKSVCALVTQKRTPDMTTKQEQELIIDTCRRGVKSFYSFFTAPKEVVDVALNALPKSSMSFIKEVYNNELGKRALYKLPKEDKNHFNNIVVMTKRLIQKIKKDGVIVYPKDSLYAKYPYAPELIDKAISTLSQERQDFLKRVYANGFNQSLTTKLTKEERRELNVLIRAQLNYRLKNLVEVGSANKLRVTKSFYERFPCEPELVDKAVFLLTEEKQEFLKRVYADGLDKPATVKLSKHDHDVLYNLIPSQIKVRIARLTSQKSKRMKKTLKSFYDCYAYDKELIDKAILTLPQERQDLLKRVYANGLDKPLSVFLNPDESRELYIYIRQQLNRRLVKLSTDGTIGKRKAKSFYERFSYEPAVIDQAVLLLPLDKQELLHRIFPEGFDKPLVKELTNSERSQLYACIPAKIKKIVTDLGIIKSDNEQIEFLGEDSELPQKVLSISHSKQFGDLLNYFSYKDAIIVSLRLGLVDNEKYSITKISKFFGVSEQYIIEIVKKALLLYKQELQNELDNNSDFTRKRKNF